MHVPDELTDASGHANIPLGFEAVLDRFVLFWGEMASHWGINRTMAQIHALLYAAEDPLDTDAIMARLQISRGNANMNLHALMNWNLVRKVHQPGSRKDYFTAEKDVWQFTAQIIQERERREIKPVMQQLQECRDLLCARDPATLSASERQFCARIEKLMALVEVVDGFSRAFLPFVQERNLPMIRQLIAFAEALQEQTPDAESPDALNLPAPGTPGP